MSLPYDDMTRDCHICIHTICCLIIQMIVLSVEGSFFAKTRACKKNMVYLATDKTINVLKLLLYTQKLIQQLTHHVYIYTEIKMRVFELTQSGHKTFLSKSHTTVDWMLVKKALKSLCYNIFIYLFFINVAKIDTIAEKTNNKAKTKRQDYNTHKEFTWC